MEKIKKYFENISALELALLFAVIWFIDLMLTFIALSTIPGVYESNPISAFLFSFGYIGWIIDIILALICFFLYALFVKFCQKWHIKMMKKHKKKARLSWIFPIIALIVYWGLELYVIIHNIGVMRL